MNMGPLRMMRGGARGNTVAAVLALLCVSLSLEALAGELRIRGRVLNEDGKPAANIRVFAVCTGALPEAPQIYCGFPGTMGREEKTDGDGRFFFSGMPVAAYSVYAAIEAPRSRVAAEAVVLLQLREDVNGVELRLKPLRSITGKVEDPSGRPVANAQVSARMEEGAHPPDAQSSRTRGSGTSDADGRFELHSLADGPYRLQASAHGFGTTYVDRIVRPGDDPVTVRLQPCARVIGRAVKPDGSPVADLNDDCREGFKSRLPDGRFEDVRCGGWGEIRLCLSAPGMSRLERSLKLEPGQTVDLGDVRMEPARVLKVRVSEKGTGKPMHRAWVQVDEPLPRRSFSTDAEGQVVLTDYPDKAMDLLVRPVGWPEKRVSVARGQTEVRVELEPGVGVSGRVLTADGSPEKGVATVSCTKGGLDRVPLNFQGEFLITQGLAGGICSVTLQLFSSPMPNFEHYRMFWLDPQQPPTLEFREPPVRNPIHVRFQGGKGRPKGALLYMGELPSQLNLRTFSAHSMLPLGLPVYESQGFRAGAEEEGGFRFEKIGPGQYTLVVLLHQAAFRVPLTVGNEEQTFTVDIPKKPTSFAQ
jgi:hypothetical protein